MIRVAVTTDGFDRVAPWYESCGLAPVSLPCIRMEPLEPEALDTARVAAERADLLMVSSARALELLWPTGMPSLQVLAVGEASAEKARALGGSVVATGSSGVAGLIAGNLSLVAGRTVAYPHAAGADLADLAPLREAASSVEAHEIYRIVPVAPADDPVDAVGFASPSAVTGWHLSRDLDRLVVGVIGATTASAVSCWRPVDAMAIRPSHADLARALARRLEVAS